MKAKYKLLILSAIVFSMTISISCNEDEFLKEVPLDFYSPGDSYKTYENYQAALTDLYARIRFNYELDINGDKDANFVGTDIAFNARRDNSRRIGDYNNLITPQAELPKNEWVNWYKIISNANTILAKIDDSEMTESESIEVRAEAKLFRAWAYRHLVYLYGGIPLQLEEIEAPKADFSRASKTEVLNQIILDAADAADNLPGIVDVKDGKVSSAVANHLLAETYLALGDYEKAITAASKVIDNPAISLMTDRFGSLKDQPGDVYYDLFRVNNQNRGQGNTEAIWVSQFELDVPGGVLETSGVYRNMLERCVVSPCWTLKGPDGRVILYGGKEASTLNAGGRGVGFTRPTDYYTYEIWGLDPNDDNRSINHPDIRTSSFNIVRDLIYTEPSSAYFGESMIDYPSSQWLSQDWRWYPYPSKVTTPGQHPEGMYDDVDNQILKSTAGTTHRDMYILRLPETILLRAEAYLMKGETQKAANDINLIRNRANAVPVTAAEVDVDYILDERARELIFEEKRRLTLSRLGVLVERVRKYNPLNADDINDYNELFPIPYSEIEANKDGVLEQNPGYTN